MVQKLLRLLIVTALLITIGLPSTKAQAAEGIEIHTPYTGISVSPGESISYSFEIFNHTSNIQQVEVDVEDLAEGWDYSIVSGGWDLQEISVKPDEPAQLTIDIAVPLQVEKGNYRFKTVATSSSGLQAELPMVVTISEQGTFSTELSTEQPNMQGHSDSTFNYTVELRNRTASEQTYALVANLPRGWQIDFKSDGDSVTSVTVDSNGTKNITVNLTPPTEVAADTFQIPIAATNDSTQAELTLEAVITGTYGIELTTQSGRLSEEITAGKDKRINLVVRNTGTAPLTDVSLSANQPQGWEVDYESDSIAKIEPGESVNVQATVSASNKSIAGDYVVEMTANAPEVSSNAQFRIAVKTSMLWGWVGILIIVAVIGGIYYLIRKYGRR